MYCGWTLLDEMSLLCFWVIVEIFLVEQWWIDMKMEDRWIDRKTGSDSR